MLIAYSPDLSQEEIQDIKEQFSMQDRLIGAVTRNQYGAYDYKGNTYIVDITENYLTFNIFTPVPTINKVGNTLLNSPVIFANDK